MLIYTKPAVVNAKGWEKAQAEKYDGSKPLQTAIDNIVLKEFQGDKEHFYIVLEESEKKILQEMADKIYQAKTQEDALDAFITQIIVEHIRITFNDRTNPFLTKIPLHPFAKEPEILAINIGLKE